MASEQMPRRENNMMEREVHIEKQRKEDTGRARETRELGTHFESLPDNVRRSERGGDHKEKERELYSDRAKEAEEKAKREREKGGGGVHQVGKFEMEAEGKDSREEALRDRADLERRTREVKGRVLSGEEKERRGQVEAEKARTMENRRDDKARDRAEDKVKGRLGGTEGQGRECREEEKEEGRYRVGGENEEENERSRLGEIGKYRAQAQHKAMDAIAAAQERYDNAKQALSEAPPSSATQTSQDKSMHEKEKATQEKDATTEKGQQGYVETKDVTGEKGQKGYVGAKDTISNVAKSAVDYTAPVAEKAKDVTVESGKSAAKVAADLMDKATVAGWNAAHYSAEKTVEGTKAATNAVQGAAGYAGQKASELAAKSVGTAKGLAAAAGDTAKEYTARKKEEAERELETKRAAQNQESKQRPSAENTTGNNVQSFQGGQGQPQGRKGSEVMTTTGETLGNVATDRGSKVLGAVGETVAEIGETMIKPAEKVQQQGVEGKGGGVLDAIGETIADIAQTTKVLAVGEGETESRQSIGSKSSSHENQRGEQGAFKHD
ncbi:seed biotin-containing protein SBP65-like [Gastrolobium bilobum]|uniref:seed biotin-containing protein SBP65-like n=1 Tax=Gastrolobium bilobum TaxID=150636 RepID=UPI002AB04553|nr:seed biotin-containing protein SBP65-like [Gastrolobium bilobum]